MERLLGARPHICARPWQKTTIESDSSKVEVVGKKLLLLPKKIDPFLTQPLQRASIPPLRAVHCH